MDFSISINYKFRIYWVFDKNTNGIIESDDVEHAYFKFMEYIAEHKVKGNQINY